MRLRICLALALSLFTGWCAAAPGLLATYYNNKTLTAPTALTRIDSTVNYDWASGSPDPAVNADSFSVRWTGVVRVQTTGSYNFQTISDDGVRLYVNGALVINNWADHSATTDNSAAIALTAGIDYAITMEFYENGGLAVAKLNWKKPGDSAYSVIPASNGSLGLATGLVPILEYRFEEADWSGITGEVKDTSTSGWHGTAAGLSTIKPTTATASPAIAGSVGTCGYGVFNRANKDYVALPSTFPNLGTTSSFTATAWIRTTNRALPGQRILADDANNSSGFALSLGDRGAGVLNFYSRGTTSAYEIVTPAVIADNTWYFVAFGVDIASKTKFITVYNTAGSQLASVSAVYTESAFGTDAGDASMGGETNAANTGENTSNFGFAGNLDEMRVYPAVLSASDLATVRTTVAACAPPATLVAEYHFDETGWNGTAGELKDTAGYSGGPYNGNAQGSPRPTVGSASPAIAGAVGTCRYATLAGPTSGGGNFVVTGLPVTSTAGAQVSVSFWMYWDGTDGGIAASLGSYDLWLRNGSFGFNTDNSDVYGIASTGLANGWHHVAAVFTNGSVTSNRLYLDGVRQTLTQRAGTPNLANAVTANTLRLGGYAPSSIYRFSGRIDEARVHTGGVNAADVAALVAQTHACQFVDHFELRHASGTGLTCTPTAVTVAACQDASCSTLYTGGAAGTLTASGAGITVNWPSTAAFSIGAGSSTVSVPMQQTTAGSVVLGLSGASPVPANTTSCTFGSPSCTFTASDSGLLFDVPDHVAEVAQTVSVSAVRKSDNGLACVPAFASVSRSVTFTCATTNPSTGTRPVRVGGRALNSGNNASAACDASGQAVSLAFNASGVASTAVQYADVGQMLLNARYAGSGSDAGLVMTGSDNFIAAPASFAFSAISAAPIKAGTPFGASVTARNNAGATTPNFGRETTPASVTLAFTRAQPTGSGASNGVFTGSMGAFSAGVATSSTLVWSEVGKGDLTATLTGASYLGSGLSASGTTGTGGAVGRFTPHHFDVAVTPACSSFSYAAQPFTVTVTAKNGLATPTTTVNYDGSSSTAPNFSKATTLSDAPTLGVGSFGSTGAIAATQFIKGVATTTTPAYTFASKTTAAQTLVVRATDADSISSLGYAEGSNPLRSGRLRLSNAFGSEKSTLALAVQAQYWSGNAWVLNNADSCTIVPATAVARARYYDNHGSATSAWTSAASAITISAGNGTLTLGAPSPTTTGSVDLALNLGSGAADQSCLATHPASTGAASPWLRAQNGACSTLSDRDPSARASFGIYVPETRKTIHVRELF